MRAASRHKHFRVILFLPLRIRHRIAKHVEKRCLNHFVQLGHGLAAFRTEFVGLVEDSGDAFLFGEGGSGIEILLRQPL